MLTVENVKTEGWQAAIRGMRNPLNSWDKSDSMFGEETAYIEGRPPEHATYLCLGANDRDLMRRLLKGGPDHAKFRRTIIITCDVEAPLYWWKQADTYKVGTVTNSCSTMHTILKQPINIDMFSTDGMLSGTRARFGDYIAQVEDCRRCAKNHFEYAKEYEAENPDLAQIHRDQAQTFWRELIQLLPESFNQRRTWLLNYEVMANIYRGRRHHKLSEWHEFIDQMIEELPDEWIFTGRW